MTTIRKHNKESYQAPWIQSVEVELEHSIAAASKVEVQKVTEQWEYTDDTQEEVIDNFWK